MEIWQTYRNSDDIEGRGPMVPDLAFLHKEHAERYIDSQPGIMGRPGPWSNQTHGDWQVAKVEVIEYDMVQAKKNLEAVREAALAKLTDQEKDALGLLT